MYLKKKESKLPHLQFHLPLYMSYIFGSIAHRDFQGGKLTRHLSKFIYMYFKYLASWSAILASAGADHVLAESNLYILVVD